MTQAQEYEILDFNYKPTPDSVSLWEQTQLADRERFQDESFVTFEYISRLMEPGIVFTPNRALFCGSIVFDLLLVRAAPNRNNDHYNDPQKVDRFQYALGAFRFDVQKKRGIPEKTLICLSTDGSPNVLKLPEGHLFLQDASKCLVIKLYDPATMPPPFNSNPLT